MHTKLACLTAMTTLALWAAPSQGGDVFRTLDSTGRPIYTDRPATLPAERLTVANSSTDKAQVQQRYAEQMQRMNTGGDAASADAKTRQDVQKSAELSAQDRARRCTEARARHEQYMISHRLYETDQQSGERRYLTDTEIDAARGHSKQLMDEFCGG